MRKKLVNKSEETRRAEILFLVDLLDDVFSRHRTRDNCAVREDDGRRAGNAELLRRALYCHQWQWSHISDPVSAFSQMHLQEATEISHRVIAFDFRAASLMHRQREQHYIKSDVLSLLHDLLHLLMKFSAVWSIGVVENDDLILCVLAAHHERVIERYL